MVFIIVGHTNFEFVDPVIDGYGCLKVHSIHIQHNIRLLQCLCVHVHMAETMINGIHAAELNCMLKPMQ